MKNTILYFTMKRTLIIKIGNEELECKISPKYGLVPSIQNVNLIIKFLALWKRAEWIDEDIIVLRGDMHQLVNNCRRYLKLLDSFNNNLQNTDYTKNHKFIFRSRKDCYLMH